MAVQEYVVAPVTFSVALSPEQIVDGPETLILKPAVTVNDVGTVSTHPVTPSVTIAIKLYVAGTGGNEASILDESGAAPVIKA